MNAPPRRGAVRPSIPPAVWLATSVWVGSAGAAFAVWWCRASGRPPALVWGAAALACALALACGRHRTALAALALALAVGMGTSTLHACWMLQQGSVAEAAGPVSWSGTVVADPKDGLGGLRVTVALRDGPASGRFTLAWPTGAEVPSYGRRVTFSARLRAPGPSDTYAQQAFLRGEAGSGKPWRVDVLGWESGALGAAAALRNRCLGVLDASKAPGAAVVGSAVFGRRDVADEDGFRVVGAAHLLTASGIHLALAAAMAAGIARLAGTRRPWPAAAAAAAAVTFCFAGGLRVSLLRAAAVTIGAVLPAATGRRRQGLAGGAAAAGLLVAADPPAAWDVALWIGVAACLGVGLFGGLMAEWVRILVPKRYGRAARTVASALAVQGAVSPLAAALFGTLTPLAPVSALVVAPAVQGAVLLALTGAACMPLAPRTASWLLRAASVPGAVAASSVAWLARAGPVALPTEAWTVPVLAVWVAAGAALWILWPQPRRVWRVRAGLACVALLLAALAWPRALTPPRIVVLDVGQGDAILVQDGSDSMLIDCGPDPLTLRRALARTGVRRIGALVLTHDHADHTGGLKGLTGVATVGWVGVTSAEGKDPDSASDVGLDGPAGEAPLERLRQGMTWTVGTWDVRVLWPVGGERRLDTNDTSVVLLVERDGQRALFLGDADTRAQEGVLRRFSDSVDVLKVAHHGSVNGLVPRALRTWRPGEALISVGTGNRFGHPDPETLEQLRSIDTRVWRTDLQGDLTVSPTTAGWALGSARSASIALDARIWRRPGDSCCATIVRAQGSTGRTRTSILERTRDGRRPVGPQARLSHLRLRAAVAGPRGPPAQGPVGEGRRPGLQHGDLRR
ncbi:MAG: ComEC/Rec2 family competence protein [Coriobacteriia bacterium]|nr:ComEC/Rec2 family competence protein [Coriobacteriia bacterium]